MTGDRQRHRREAFEGGGGEVPGDRGRRPREPAHTHFRHLTDNRAPGAEPPAGEAGA